jgi:hypothetical protein
MDHRFSDAITCGFDVSVTRNERLPGYQGSKNRRAYGLGGIESYGLLNALGKYM